MPPGPTASASTVWYVAPGGSDSNSCTSPSTPCQHIQTAINRAASGDAVDVAAGTYTETLSISTSLSLTGAGANSTIIDGNNHGTVLSVAPTATVTLANVTVQHGNAGATTGYFGGGIYNLGALTVLGSVITQNSAPYVQSGYIYGYGGGIYNEGTLTLTNSAISNNSASGGSNGIYNIGTLALTSSAVYSNTGGYEGGGIGQYGGALTLTSSTVYSNTAGYNGGGIDHEGSSSAVTLTNSIVSGNSAESGGGILSAGGTMTLINSTISSNSATGGGGGIWIVYSTVTLTNSTVSGNDAPHGNGGGINNNGTLAQSPLTLTNTILAGNTANNTSFADCSGPLTTAGYNLVGIGDGCGLTNGLNGDQVGTSSSPINPLLGPLQDNGGPTETMALLPGSPAIDYVPPSNCTSTTDQRGEPRPDESVDGGFCDIGAYEYQAAPPPPPSVASSPTSSVVGQSISLTGTGFAPNEPISVYWDRTSTAPLTTATANPDGSFTATFTVPQAISGAHTLIAVGETSGLTATAQFTVTPSAALLHASGIQRSRNVITDNGFGANEQVTAYWGKKRAVVLGIGMTTATGTVALTFTVPMSPTGPYQVVSVGQTSGAVLTDTFTLNPYLTIKPTSGVPGSHTYVSGTGFGAHERVSIKWNCPTASCTGATVLGTATTNGEGDFTHLKVTVPATATVGTYPVGGIGQTSHAFANSYFTVT